MLAPPDGSNAINFSLSPQAVDRARKARRAGSSATSPKRHFPTTPSPSRSRASSTAIGGASSLRDAFRHDGMRPCKIAQRSG